MQIVCHFEFTTQSGTENAQKDTAIFIGNRQIYSV